MALIIFAHARSAARWSSAARLLLPALYSMMAAVASALALSVWPRREATEPVGARAPALDFMPKKGITVGAVVESVVYPYVRKPVSVCEHRSFKVRGCLLDSLGMNLVPILPMSPCRCNRADHSGGVERLWLSKKWSTPSAPFGGNKNVQQRRHHEFFGTHSLPCLCVLCDYAHLDLA